jgi:hypothetical protein
LLQPFPGLLTRFLLFPLDTNPHQNSCFIREYGKNRRFGTFPLFQIRELAGASCVQSPVCPVRNGQITASEIEIIQGSPVSSLVILNVSLVMV